MLWPGREDQDASPSLGDGPLSRLGNQSRQPFGRRVAWREDSSVGSQLSILGALRWLSRRGIYGEADRGMLDQHPGRLARADGGWRVVATVVKTPWTGSASQDAAGRRDAGSSADAGLDRRDESAWTGAGLLITQRSRVQIPPPLPSSSRSEPRSSCSEAHLFPGVHEFVHETLIQTPKPA